MKKTNATRILDKHKIPYELIAYQYDKNNLNVEKIASDNQLELHEIYKTLVVEGDKTGIVVALVSGNKTLSLKKLAIVTGNKKMTLLSVDKLQKQTGYIRGGCSPIGMKKSFPIIGDYSILELDQIYINAGIRGLLLTTSQKVLGKVIDIDYNPITQ